MSKEILATCDTCAVFLGSTPVIECMYFCWCLYRRHNSKPTFFQFFTLGLHVGLHMDFASVLK